MIYTCYVFVHKHLSPVQKAVQSVHAVAEMFNNAEKNSCSVDISTWAHRDKTVILLDGGNSNTMKEIESLVKKLPKNISRGIFYEDEDTLGGMLTSISVILPRITEEEGANHHILEFVKFKDTRKLVHS